MEKEDLMKLVIDKLYKVHTAGVPKKSTYKEDQNTGGFYTYINEVAKSVDDDQFPSDIKQRLVKIYPVYRMLIW